ncbi:MAG: Ldh family oxidoreductase [Chloroflexi bacterium]|nr:Ldh family oxidoreductase [Chloroflexota bacterium]
MSAEQRSEAGDRSQSGSGAVRVPADDVRAFVRRVLLALGMRPSAADITADAMVWADARGIEPHGVAKLPLLAARIEAGVTAPDAEPTVLAETDTTVLMDAGTGWGQPAAAWAMELACEKARLHQVGVAVVRNSSSLGALGYYPMIAVRAGSIGLAITNSMPLLAPWGGTAKLLGNQGYAIGCPAGRHPPLLLDTSNSATSWGAIRLAEERGESLEPGLAFDRSGQPTVDPAAALQGLLAPAAGHKGYGLALMFEVLTGVLAGLAVAPHVGSPDDCTRTQQVSHFLLALDPTAFLLRETFLARVDALIDEVHAVPPAPGIERVRVPGERSADRAESSHRDGILLSAARVSELRALAARIGVDPLA